MLKATERPGEAHSRCITCKRSVYPTSPYDYGILGQALQLYTFTSVSDMPASRAHLSPTEASFAQISQTQQVLTLPSRHQSRQDIEQQSALRPNTIHKCSNNQVVCPHFPSNTSKLHMSSTDRFLLSGIVVPGSLFPVEARRSAPSLQR
jgi:hypothetical protein